jgi:hypothetical protein
VSLREIRAKIKSIEDECDWYKRARASNNGFMRLRASLFNFGFKRLQLEDLRFREWVAEQLEHHFDPPPRSLLSAETDSSEAGTVDEFREPKPHWLCRESLERVVARLRELNKTPNKALTTTELQRLFSIPRRRTSKWRTQGSCGFKRFPGGPSGFLVSHLLTYFERRLESELKRAGRKGDNSPKTKRGSMGA